MTASIPARCSTSWATATSCTQCDIPSCARTDSTGSGRIDWRAYSLQLSVPLRNRGLGLVAVAVLPTALGQKGRHSRLRRRVGDSGPARSALFGMATQASVRMAWRPQSYSRTYSDSFGRDRRRAGKPLPSATAFCRVSARYCVPADQPRDGPFRAGITWCHMFHSSPARRKPSIIFCRSLSRVNRTDSAIHPREMSG
jgi:hypothetical protein